MKYIFILFALLVIMGNGNNEVEAPTIDWDSMSNEEYILTRYNDPLFLEIARCESGYREWVNNAEFGEAGGGGLLQIIPSSWRYYGEQLWGDDWVNKDKYDRVDNTELAWHMYTTQGTSPWDPYSRHCWGHMV